MKRILLSLVLGCLPLAALADGMVIPTVAYPATVTIPDQRALICFSNGIERLVIETRFTGAGTNFAWVVPLPSQPVIEEATTGLFPTLQYLFRPEIVHNVPRYFAGFLTLIGVGYLLLFVRLSGRLKKADILACIVVGIAAASGSERGVFSVVAFCFVTAVLVCDVILIRVAQRPAFAVFGWTFLGAFCLCGTLLPAGASLGVNPAISAENISILERKLVGVFETTTIASHDAHALQAWLSDNGYALPANSEPVIASYVKDEWVFVATKIHRNDASLNTSTPHPLSFAFKTARPVYPMQLTGLNGQPLSVDLYIFGNTSFAAPHFQVESCTRRDTVHPLLHRWTAGLPVATKLAAKLSPAVMRSDVRLDQMPAFVEQKSRVFSPQGALITALNWTVGVFAIGLAMIWLSAFVHEKDNARLPQLIAAMTLASAVVGSVIYLSLPKIEVKLTRGRGHFTDEMRAQQLAVRFALGDFEWHTTAEARTGLRRIFSNPTNAIEYGARSLDNYSAGGQFREEDSPGNYLLRETNNKLQLIFFDTDGREEISETVDLSTEH